MEEKIFMQIAQKISKEIGVQLGDKQKVLVRSRIMKRVRDLDMPSIFDYNEYLKLNYKSEFSHLVSLLTTHHTFFFREFIHFEHLKIALPSLVKDIKAMGRNKLQIWCAASSYGHEVYSLSIFLKVHLKEVDPTMSYEIVGSDVDSQSVASSQKGIYKWNEVKEIPSLYLNGHFSRGTGEISDFVKIKADVKEKCSFKTVNLINIGQSMAHQKFDVVFCRNVFIYFNPQQISDITTALTHHMHPHGQLIVGLSESLMQCDANLYHLGKAIYSLKKPEKELEKNIRPSAGLDSGSSYTPQSISTIKVFCVDDSPTVLTILKKILRKDSGFEIVATAKSGKEAAELAPNLKFDIMTLDIHMPEMTGLEYLQAHYSPTHPPVVIVSSVSRENADLAFGCLTAGASDYVEKPTLSGIEEKTEEIHMKLRTALIGHKGSKSTDKYTMDSSFSVAPIIYQPENKLRIISAGLGDMKKLQEILSTFKAPQPPTVVVIEDLGALDTSVVQNFSSLVSLPVKSYASGALEKNKIYFCSEQAAQQIHMTKLDSPPVVLALCTTGPKSLNVIQKISQPIIVAEESSSANSKTFQKIETLAKYKIPYSSLAYESEKILSKDHLKAA